VKRALRRSARASSKYTIDTLMKSVTKAMADVMTAKKMRGMEMRIRAGGARRYNGLKKRENMMELCKAAAFSED
jgi:hypothetical protein